MTKSNYGRFRRRLGSLGKDGGAEQKAASVASLLGGTSVAEALTKAAERFRAQPLKTLTLEALLTNESDPSLYANSVSAKLGEVHAFVWHTSIHCSCNSYSREVCVSLHPRMQTRERG